jgi:hypothetical protein
MKQLVDELLYFDNIETFLGNPSSTQKNIGSLEVLPMLARDKIIRSMKRDYYY